MLKKIMKIIGIILCSLAAVAVALVILILLSDNGKIMLPVEKKDVFQVSGSNVPGSLAVNGNKILNPEGQEVLLRGVMAPDPDRLNERKKFNKAYYEGIGKTGANVLRVPVHPERWHNVPDYLWRYLDPVVTWAGEMGLYVVIDWHCIGSIASGKGDAMPDIDEKPLDYSMAFWQKTAAYFKNASNVIFEIYNEPAEINAEDWRRSAMVLVDTIRKTGAAQMVIVGGIDYAHDLSWVKENPIADDNLAYAAHVFPDRSKDTWQGYFGNISKDYPVIATEWGFMDENRETTEQRYLSGDEKSFGRPLLDYLNENGIGNMAAWYDDQWEAPMFKEGYKGLTNFGEFVLSNIK